MPGSAAPNAAAAPRRLICAGCGAAFACTMDVDCWCAAEPAQLPMPAEGADCLCPRCLRKAAKAARADG